MVYSSYYQAQVQEKETWFLVATLRSFEHLMFDRTLDKTTSTFEFFVPQDREATFLAVMQYYSDKGIIKNLVKLPNRLMDPHASL
jgi:hypothetical protein